MLQKKYSQWYNLFCPMWKAREVKKRPKGKRWFLKSISIFFLCLFVLLAYYLPTHYFFKKASFISPIPQVKTKSSQSKSTVSQRENLTALLKRSTIAFVDVSLSSDSSFTVLLATGEEILFSPQKNLESQISSLQLIASRLTIEGKRFSRLDFRFDKPVITLK